MCLLAEVEHDLLELKEIDKHMYWEKQMLETIFSLSWHQKEKWRTRESSVLQNLDSKTWRLEKKTK